MFEWNQIICCQCCLNNRIVILASKWIEIKRLFIELCNLHSIVGAARHFCLKEKKISIQIINSNVSAWAERWTNTLSIVQVYSIRCAALLAWYRKRSLIQLIVVRIHTETALATFLIVYYPEGCCGTGLDRWRNNRWFVCWFLKDFHLHLVFCCFLFMAFVVCSFMAFEVTCLNGINQKLY